MPGERRDNLVRGLNWGGAIAQATNRSDTIIALDILHQR